MTKSDTVLILEDTSPVYNLILSDELFDYMKENDLKYKDIHKMSTLRLLNELSVYFDKEVS